jgi:hypothetical protein
MCKEGVHVFPNIGASELNLETTCTGHSLLVVCKENVCVHVCVSVSVRVCV